MKGLKPSYHQGHAALQKSQRAEQRATDAFTAKQDRLSHQGRKEGSFSAPLKKQSRDAVGGYRSGNPFTKGK
jgi:hypothetical protein